jgi:hypothetical protein
MYLCEPCAKRIHSGIHTGKHKVIDLDDMTPDESMSRLMVNLQNDFNLFCGFVDLTGGACVSRDATTILMKTQLFIATPVMSSHA